jgi:hypothetical protein
MYSDDVNIWAETYVLQRKTQALYWLLVSDALEVNGDKTWSCVEAGWNQRIRIENSSFERIEHLNYLGTTLTNQNFIQEESKSRLKLGNVFYHSVQNLLSSSFLSKYTKIKTYVTTILPFVLLGYHTWSLTFRGENRPRVFKKRVLRRIFWPRGTR